VLIPGQRVEKWTVVRLLAQGGQGAVYEVLREDIGKRGALKVLLSHRMAAQVLQRFINEAKATNAINHPNIPQVFDHGMFNNGTAWMVMEFIAGQTLEDRLAQRRLTQVEILAIVEDVAAALAAAHDKNIIHRDIKPTNIMLVADEDQPTGERAMVLDFGIAKLRDQGGVTNTGSMVGTPIYMALEQAAKAKDVDGRADVYSLGVVMYQMLCRRVPFRFRRDEGPWVVLTAKTAESTPIETYAPQLPADVRGLVNAMVQKDRERRPRMSEVRATLRQLQGLAPMKQTGTHEAQRAVSTSLPTETGALEYDEDEDESTGGLLTSLVDAQTAGPMPIEQKANGELSPQASLRVPHTISDVETKPVPVPGPLLVAGPSAPTVQPAPTPLLPEQSASPSAPTVRASLASAPVRALRRRVIWMGAALVVGIVLMGVWTLGSRGFWVSTPRVDLGMAFGDLSESAPPPTDLADPARPDLATSAVPDLSQPVDLLRNTPLNRVRCMQRSVDKGCLLTPMTHEQQRALLAALRENKGMQVCADDRVSIVGLPLHPTIQGPATWLKRQDLGPLRDALRGLDGNFPKSIEIQCKK
jgi:serine/threonine-protein kinase